MVESFTELELLFENCLLQMHRRRSECVDLDEKISVCLVHVFRFKVHSDMPNTAAIDGGRCQRVGEAGAQQAKS